MEHYQYTRISVTYNLSGFADFADVGLVGEEGRGVLYVQHPDDEVRRAVQVPFILKLINQPP